MTTHENANADQMVCRACGRQERASEGYPCDGCGTFICVVCNMWGVTLCKDCVEKRLTSPTSKSA